MSDLTLSPSPLPSRRGNLLRVTERRLVPNSRELGELQRIEEGQRCVPLDTDPAGVLRFQAAHPFDLQTAGAGQSGHCALADLHAVDRRAVRAGADSLGVGNPLANPNWNTV